ncbi:hypothetical protein [Teredinibacter sp. KSP-S5-2]|uniref:hypothetical protein n=1 Tax=Teredinibacter sp. KSP-S5-2 TaxID=3034506 RepID=UPI0029349EFF|nr:hypothetical protein [Teredinibacter sp. KSP-S5-2]WNO10468.1 hypothetical protein P5V12_04715 [Teredinibacter sp. KSP-S5-2]
MTIFYTDNLPDGYSVVTDMDYIYPKQKLFVVVGSSELVLIVKKPSPYPDEEDEPGGLLVHQTEFPRAAVHWIVDVVENRLWKSEAEGGLPSRQNFVDEDVAGENLKIRRSMNVSGPSEKGFFFINFSRPDRRIVSAEYQEIQITDTLLREGGLLDVLKSL